MSDQSMPAAQTVSISTLVSPFVIGRPLRADEPIFGRDEVFRFVGQQLARFSSVNVVGERRMGKSSLLNHLLGHPEKYFSRSPDEPPLLLARVDMQAGISDARQFYRGALVEWLKELPTGAQADALRKIVSSGLRNGDQQDAYGAFRDAWACSVTRMIRRLLKRKQVTRPPSCVNGSRSDSG
jgi:hypothetical protein